MPEKEPKKTAIDHAVEYLETQINIGKWKNGDRLPPIVELAKLADRSVITIHGAIGILKSRGIITVKRGQGIYLGKCIKKNTTEPEKIKKNRFKDIARIIERSIVNGEFDETNELPSIKELCFKFGCGHETIKQTLNELVVDKRIFAYGKKYRIQKNTPHFSSTIVLVQGQNSNVMLEYSHARSWYFPFLHTLEKTCTRHGWQLERHFYQFRLGNDHTFDNAMGFIIAIERMEEGGSPGLTRQLIEAFSRFNKPIIVLDGPQIIPNEFIYRNVFSFPMNDTQAGFQVGRYLLDMGHKKICFIAQRTSKWSEERLAGLRAAYTKAGFDNSAISSWNAVDFPWIEFPDGQNQPQTKSGLTKSETQELSVLRSTLDTLNALPTGVQTNTPTKSKIRDILNFLGFCQELPYIFSFVLKKALSLKQCTAWVIWDDYTAVFAALPFLQKNGIKVPQDISVISFNNMIEAYDNDLCSYDFNVAGFVGEMIECILQPETKKKKGRVCGQDNTGFIASRGSVRKI